MDLHLQRGAERRLIFVVDEGEKLRLRGEDGSEHEVLVVAHDRHSLLLEIDGLRHRVRWAADGHELHLQLRGHAMRFHLLDDEADDDMEMGEGSPVVRAPMPGKVLELLVAEGDAVVVGQPVIRVEAMKMEVDLPAQVDGTVASIRIEVGQIADPEQALITITPAESAD